MEFFGIVCRSLASKGSLYGENRVGELFVAVLRLLCVVETSYTEGMESERKRAASYIALYRGFWTGHDQPMYLSRLLWEHFKIAAIWQALHSSTLKRYLCAYSRLLILYPHAVSTKELKSTRNILIPNRPSTSRP